MIEKVYEELDDAKAEIEKLISEYCVKADLCDNLKRSNNDQVKRIQELNLKLVKQAQEVEQKADEVYAVKQSLKDLECKLKEKENIIKSLTSANDKLRVVFNSKLKECEEERIKVVSSLEEANAKISDLEHENCAFIDKIEVLKEGIFSVSQKKCANESKMANVSKQMSENGDLFDKLEDEKVKLEEQLKWETEQFKHLEEAHERLRDNLRAKEKEWDMEKCTFFDDISALKTKLESQFKLSEVFKRRLESCTQSLGREEDRRKCLDIQLSESNFDLKEKKSNLERLTNEKEEMECKIRKLEEENQDMVFSLKELKEYKIREASNTSTIKKLQNELKTLEQIHNDCSNHSKAKEAEWISRFEKVGELNSCRLELESKEHRLKDITAELEDYNSLILQLTIEKVAMESTLSEARLQFESFKMAEEEKLNTLEQIHGIKVAEWNSVFEKTDAELNSCSVELESKEGEWSSRFEKRQNFLSIKLSIRLQQPLTTALNRFNLLRCNCILNPAQAFGTSAVKNAALALSSALQGKPFVLKLLPAVGILVFAVWGLGPLMRRSRNIFLHEQYLSAEHWIQLSFQVASQIIKIRLLTFVKSLSTVLALAYCLSSAIQQTQNFLMESYDATDTRNMGFQFAGKAEYTAVWVAAVSLFMELLGFSTQKWLTAGGLGTVLLTLAGREIFTNFLSSAMIHATRPFIVNEWIKAKIEGYEVSGTVEIIVADMRKVLAKNPQVEQQRLHRRVFLENVDPENQSLLILISCFEKTSHYEEYLCVKEAILLDLLRVISHHRARLATPLRTIQKIYNESSDLDGFPFADSVFTRGRAPTNRPLLLIEPNYKVNGEEKSKGQNSMSSIKSTSKTEVSKTKPTSDSKEGPVTTDKKRNPDTNITSDGVKVSNKVVENDINKTDSKKAVESEKSSVTEQKTTRPVMEENIVLGVALDGFKRTLPIEEGMDTEVKEKELPKSMSTKGSPLSEKDKKDGNTPSSSSTDKK